MDQLNPHARHDEYGSRINRAHSPVLVYSIPTFTILLGSIVANIPIATALPLMPPLGFLLLIGWRLVRPGLFPVWIGFPLGLFDDLFSGQPFGSAILLWSVAMLVIEAVDVRFPWRSFMQDWMAVAVAISSYVAAAAILSGADLSWAGAFALIPQILLSVLIYPMVARMVARLDRLRLMRVRTIR
ncbi:rod shape-determining protein MreD [Pontixanthobacter sp. CEM42]|uniref:rod shape-determining protein MreD n=1 Tax=Pontixanthobacter sp. CEM42 TaxID=2792077 RepID=UPI001AE09DB6|nr:rod shape-determining protein MreD [Pontixanthobacter sp. CEM42]